jgi:hypothetical protein
MKHIQYIDEVRKMLRDDSYPEIEITAALNRIIGDVNNLGKFRFHEQSYTLTLTANNYTYAVPSTVQSERLFLYANNEVPRRRELWTGTPLIPDTTGSTPSEWFRYSNNWYIVPIPDTTMAANNVTVLYDADLVAFNSYTDSTILPDRHRNVLIYGAVSQLRPGLLVASPEGQVKIETLYRQALTSMIEQEHFEYSSIPTLRSGMRWRNFSSMGHSGTLR